MEKIGYLFAILIFIAATSFTNPNEPNEKVVLSSLKVTDCNVEAMAAAVDRHIGQTPNEHLWPVTKMVFYKENDKQLIDVVAIDNNWFQLFGGAETPYGYFIMNGRLFIVASKGNVAIDFTKFFEKTGLIKAFDKPDVTIALFKECPTWIYEYHDGKLEQIGTLYTEQLTKE